MSRRAVIYARVSSDEQRGNYSIPTQVSECRKYLGENSYSLVGDHWIDVETGRDVAPNDCAVRAYVDDYTSRELNRPSLDAALQFLERTGFDIFVVHSLDRLARDPYIRQTLEFQIEALDARVEYVLGSYDNSPEGEVRKDLDATFSKWENLRRVERSKRGKRGKAERGKFVAGMPPFGYRLNKNASSGLEIDKKEASVVCRIFELYVREGKSIRGIVEVLTAEKHQTRHGNTTWARSTVTRILRNEIYIGRWFYNKTKRVYPKRVKRPKSDWIQVKVPEIVDGLSFESAQDLLRYNKQIKRRQPKRVYMLGGMVFCVDCGRPFASQTSLAGRNRRTRDAKYYRHRSKEGHCRNQQVSARLLEPLVWYQISNILVDPENLRTGYIEALNVENTSRTKLMDRVGRFKSDVATLDAKLDNLTDLYLDPDFEFSKVEYLRQRKRLEEERKEINVHIQEAEREVNNMPIPIEFESVDYFTSEITSRLNGEMNLSLDEKREILRILHVRVLIDADRQVRVEGWFGENAVGPLPIPRSWSVHLGRERPYWREVYRPSFPKCPLRSRSM